MAATATICNAVKLTEVVHGIMVAALDAVCLPPHTDSTIKQTIHKRPDTTYDGISSLKEGQVISKQVDEAHGIFNSTSIYAVIDLDK